jgi:hypothetical protein
MSVLVECDKELALHVYLAVRARLRRSGGGKERAPKIVIVDGRPARARRRAAATWRAC